MSEEKTHLQESSILSKKKLKFKMLSARFSCAIRNFIWKSGKKSKLSVTMFYIQASQAIICVQYFGEFFLVANKNAFNVLTTCHPKLKACNR